MIPPYVLFIPAEVLESIGSVESCILMEIEHTNCFGGRLEREILG